MVMGLVCVKLVLIKAELGYNYKYILKHYYKGIKIEKIDLMNKTCFKSYKNRIVFKKNLS